MKTNNSVYDHPTPARIWHGINAFCFTVLVVTGLQIRFAALLDMFSLESAIILHDFVGFIMLGAYVLWIMFYTYTGDIKTYFSNLSKPRLFFRKTISQARYYGYGVFKGEKNPHIETDDDRFNPMQRLSYIAVIFILIPIQVGSGFFIWYAKQAGSIEMAELIRIAITLHVLMSYILCTFLIAHIYLSKTVIMVVVMTAVLAGMWGLICLISAIAQFGIPELFSNLITALTG